MYIVLVTVVEEVSGHLERDGAPVWLDGFHEASTRRGLLDQNVLPILRNLKMTM